MVQYLKKFFTYEGRIGRKQYLKNLAVVILVNVLTFFAMFGVAYLAFGIGYLDFALNIRPVMVLTSLSLLFFPAVKRLHDVGWPGWIFSIFVFTQVCGLMVVPDASGDTHFMFEFLNAFEREWVFFTAGVNLINSIVAFILIFKKGTPGSNPYGPDPLAA